jgi:hypothetical protein
LPPEQHSPFLQEPHFLPIPQQALPVQHFFGNLVFGVAAAESDK